MAEAVSTAMLVVLENRTAARAPGTGPRTGTAAAGGGAGGVGNGRGRRVRGVRGIWGIWGTGGGVRDVKRRAGGAVGL